MTVIYRQNCLMMKTNEELIIKEIIADFNEDKPINKVRKELLPQNEDIDQFINEVTDILFAGGQEEKILYKQILEAKEHLVSLIMAAYVYRIQPIEAQQLASNFIATLKGIRDILNTDLIAAFEGDPAANSYNEIVACYPGFKAVTIYRIAHQLYLEGIPLLPRLMTEKAHSETGIDIHAAAQIGAYFFMDHGTGIVIGETTIIGNHVKIYQGVTLGALSTKGGQKLKNKKRHPTIMDNVTIYSNSSILGGDTVIGEGVTIKGNTFITSSVFKNDESK